MKKTNLILILITLLLVFNSCSKRKKKQVSSNNNLVKITFTSNPANSGFCNITNVFFNNMKIVMEIGTLDNNNNIIWDDTRKQIYNGNDALNCCSYPFGVPKEGSYVVKFTVIHNSCLECCSNNCNGNFGKPMYQKEIIMPG